MRVLTTIRKAEYAELVALFFIQGAAAGMWLVPLTGVLEAHGLGMLRPYGYAATGLAAFISPLIFGAMADRHVSPVKVLRGLALGTTVMATAVSSAINAHWNVWLVLALIQIYSLCAAPLISIASTIIFARLADSQKEFGPIRGMYTLGWIVGCWVISGLGADRSTHAGYAASITWLAVAGFTFFLPPLEVPPSVQSLTLRQRLGWDALTLLKNPDHRVVFFTVGLLAIPIGAFYPYTPPNLRELGLQHTTAWMSLGQVTELIMMFSLGALLAKWRLKWIFVLGLGFTVLRFLLCAVGGKFFLLAGVFLHGASFVPRIHHRSNLPRPTHRPLLACARAGIVYTGKQRFGESVGLPERRRVVRRMHRRRRNALDLVLERPRRRLDRGVGLFPGGLSWAIAAGEPIEKRRLKEINHVREAHPSTSRYPREFQKALFVLQRQLPAAGNFWELWPRARLGIYEDDPTLV